MQTVNDAIEMLKKCDPELECRINLIKSKRKGDKPGESLNLYDELIIGVIIPIITPIERGEK